METKFFVIITITAIKPTRRQSGAKYKHIRKWTVQCPSKLERRRMKIAQLTQFTSSNRPIHCNPYCAGASQLHHYEVVSIMSSPARSAPIIDQNSARGI